MCFFFFKQKTAYEMRISDWSSDVCSSDLGKVALMANWFGFAAYADTSPESCVKGLVDVALLPAGPGGRSVSLNVFWVLTIDSGSRRKQLAWDLLRHCATAPMDKLTTTEGALGVRKSTWAEPEIHADVPYYHRPYCLT